MVEAAAEEVKEEEKGQPGQAVTEQGKGLYAKIAQIQGEIEQVERRGHADVSTSSGSSYSYDYILESDLMAAIRPKLAELGVAIFYSDQILRQEDNLTVVRVTYVLADGESGETVTMTAEGYGTDKGDKGANKAKTSAVRYLLWKWFLIPSDVDPEQDSVARAPRKRQAAKTQPSDQEHAESSTSGPGISDAQRAKIYATLSDLGKRDPIYTEEWLKASILGSYGTESVNDLTKGQASEIIEYLSGKLKEFAS